MKDIQNVKIFCSYAHEDLLFVLQLKTHFASLKRIYPWLLWTDMEICAGEEWAQTIQSHLDTAQIILLLISPDFMNSDYCYRKEMMRAMERHEQREAHVIPIIVRSVALWEQAPFGKLQVLPTGGVPITDRYWHTPDKAFTHVIEKISEIISLLTDKNKEDLIIPEPTQTQSKLSATSSFAINSSTQIERAHIQTFEEQEDAYDFLIDMIRKYGAKKATLLQYSCTTSLSTLRRILRVGAEVTLFIQHEDTAAKIGSQLQANRIISTVRNLRSNLGDALSDPEKLKVFKYRPPCSMSAIKIDNRILYIGYYTYESKEATNQESYPSDTIDLSGHDRAAIVTWQDSEASQILHTTSNTSEEANHFQKFANTFNVLEQNYRTHGEIVSF
jgi:hypothetical protein